MPAGTYYIGDPCIIIKGNPGYLWIEKLWALFYRLNRKAAVLEIDGVKLFIGRTYGGDGVYNGIAVDTGTIAVIRVNSIKNDERFNFGNLDIRGTKFITAKSPFTIAYENGNFQIGNFFTIDTRF